MSVAQITRQMLLRRPPPTRCRYGGEEWRSQVIATAKVAAHQSGRGAVARSGGGEWRYRGGLELATQLQLSQGRYLAAQWRIGQREWRSQVTALPRALPASSVAVWWRGDGGL